MYVYVTSNCTKLGVTLFYYQHFHSKLTHTSDRGCSSLQRQPFDSSLQEKQIKIDVSARTPSDR